MNIIEFKMMLAPLIPLVIPMVAVGLALGLLGEALFSLIKWTSLSLLPRWWAYFLF